MKTKTAEDYIKTLFETHADKEGNVRLGKQSLINLLANFHSQFSIGGEEALRDRLKLFEAADGNQLLTESEIDLIAESLTKEGYLAAYSGEGIRQGGFMVKEEKEATDKPIKVKLF